MKHFVTFVQGFIMGIAEVVPGVSGSTLALVMNIYDDFIDFLHGISDFAKSIIKFVVKKEFKFADLKQSFFDINFRFGIVLGLGMVVAILSLSHLVTYLLDNQPQYVYAFFFGLVLISVTIPLGQVNRKNWNWVPIFLGSFLVFFLFFSIDPSNDLTSPSYVLMFFGGFLAISAMVLPGVSGSFVLLMLGLYEYIFEVLSALTKFEAKSDDILRIVVFILGILSGFIIFIRVVKLALKNYKSMLMAFLAGLMLASLRVLWPFMEIVEDVKVSKLDKIMPWEVEAVEFLVLLGLMVVAAVLVLALKRVSDRL